MGKKDAWRTSRLGLPTRRNGRLVGYIVGQFPERWVAFPAEFAYSTSGRSINAFIPPPPFDLSSRGALTLPTSRLGCPHKKTRRKTQLQQQEKRMRFASGNYDGLRSVHRLVQQSTQNLPGAASRRLTSHPYINVGLSLYNSIH